jgi:hypothetical protein
MSANDYFASELRAGARYWFHLRSRIFWASAVLIGLALVGLLVNARGEADKHARVSGAGKTIIEGGTGGTTPAPVTTLVAFHADAQGGDFECLAFTSSQVGGAGSGEFDVNAMYVTGKVSSLQASNGMAILRGTATVTGLGAGHDLAFVATVYAGGPGSRIKLEVSGLTFLEILVDGHINIE